MIRKSKLSQNGRATRNKMNKRGNDENLGQQQSIMKLLDRFYRNDTNLRKLHEILDKKSGIALRVLDWYATNYIKKNDTYFFIKKEGIKRKYTAYPSYQSFLKSYSKKFFDPFRRNYPIIFIDKNNEKLDTAICQLNFLRWMIEYGNWDYVKQNKKKIEQHMQNVINNPLKNKNLSPKSSKLKRKKRKELSIAATRTVTKHNVKVRVKFD